MAHRATTAILKRSLKIEPYAVSLATIPMYPIIGMRRLVIIAVLFACRAAAPHAPLTENWATQLNVQPSLQTVRFDSPTVKQVGSEGDWESTRDGTGHQTQAPQDRSGQMAIRPRQG
jgi:hypothetical protein